MNKLLSMLIILVSVSCSQANKKIPVYAWMGGPGDATDQQIKDEFKDLKKKGIDGLMYNSGWNLDAYKRVGKIAREEGLEFHAWIPTLTQNYNPDMKPEWYAINGVGESAYDKPAYADHYHFVCPNRPEVQEYLKTMYGKVADIPEVDGIHLDFIRFPDVILAKGLWKKFNLVMDREYPQYDYCYCDKCVNDFLSATGIDIRSVSDPSQVDKWKQFRYDLITNLVNSLTETVHARNKKITAAVFPGPYSVAKVIVRQEWDKWKLDAVYPMLYNDFYLEDTEWIGKMVKEGVTSLNNSIPLYSGLFIGPHPENKANDPDPENHGLSPEELEPAIRASMENGAAGICLFTPGRMTSEDWEVFEQAIKNTYVKR